MYKNLHRGKFV